MSPAHPDASRYARTAVNTFIVLLVLTGITVAVSYVHLALPMAVGVAFVIAVVKGSLVAGVFMHLGHERKLIYGALALTLVLVLGLLFLPVLTVRSGLAYPDGSRSVSAGVNGVLAAPAHAGTPHE
jgi:caa(3)-type oxidase subunit IV